MYTANYSCLSLMSLNFLDRFSKNTEITYYTQILLNGSRGFACGRTGGETDRHDEANSRISQLCEHAFKKRNDSLSTFNCHVCVQHTSFIKN
jgi:hypothetical protein